MLIPHVGKPSLYPKKKFTIIRLKLSLVEITGKFIDTVQGAGPKPSANLDYSVPIRNCSAGWDCHPIQMKHWYGMHQPSLLKVMRKPCIVNRKYRKAEVKGLG